MKHSGKSSVGRALARALKLPFFDSDRVIMDLRRATGGREANPRGLYLAVGEAGFRRLEEAAAIALAQTPGGMVLACGGGMVENEPALAALSAAFTRVFLDEDEEVLFRRVMRKGRPPFVDAARPRQSFAELYARRTARATDAADMVIDCRGRNVDQVAEALREQLREAEHAG